MASFTSFDGTKIAFRAWGSELGGVPVVLHHGFAAESYLNWVTPGVVDRITAEGRWVIAIDARGHGDSDKPHDAAKYDAGQMVTDVSCLIDHVGAKHVDFVGYAMGSRVGLQVAMREPRLRSLVVAGLGGDVLQAQPVDVSPIAAALRAPRASDVPEATARAIRRLAKSTGGDLEALAAIASVFVVSVAGVETIAIPTLVLAGRDNPRTAGAERIAAAIFGARLVVVPGDHLSSVALPPFAQAIVEFLRQQRRGSER